MKQRDFGELLLLGALWGASFLFMRVAAPAFGAVPLAALRVAGAALLLLPLLAFRGASGEMRRHWRPIAVVGLGNSALPFLCFAQAARVIEAGLASILNATAPLFTAVLASLFFGEPGSRARYAGLLLGLVGVMTLVWDRAGLRAGADATAAVGAMALCIAAALMYGWSANFTRRHLAGVQPLAIAAGSQLAAAFALAAPALLAWPAAAPESSDWIAAGALALLCTGLAYLLYFRLIARLGPANAITVTYLVPSFAMLWAWVFLGEAVTAGMLASCALILVGVGVSTEVLRLPRIRPTQ